MKSKPMKQENKTKALVYCRVSSKKQEAEGSGLDSQETRCRQYCDTNGYEVKDVFRDSFTGGGDFMRRPAMSALLAFVDSTPHITYTVVFDDLSRFARDVNAHFLLRQEFDKRGITIECPNFTFENTPEGELVETMMAAQHQYHRKNNRRQVIQKQMARLERGCWAFHAPLGYEMKKTIDGKIAHPTKLGKVIGEGLEGFASGRFPTQIALATFWKEGGVFKGKQSPDKYIDSTKSIIQNPFYAGLIEYKKWNVAVREGKHQGVIDEKTFYQNQKRLNDEYPARFVRQDLHDDFPLRGLVKCKACDGKMTAYYSKSKTGKKYPYYSCQRKGCELRSKTVTLDAIDDGFESLCRSYKPKPELVSVVGEMFEDLWKLEMKNVSLSLDELKTKKEKLEREVGKLTDAVIDTDNETLRKQYEKRLEEKSLELETLQADLASELTYEEPYRTSYEKITGMIKSPYSIWDNATTKQKQELFFFMFAEPHSV
jgi:site-specific DNA recombinase